MDEGGVFGVMGDSKERTYRIEGTKNSQCSCVFITSKTLKIGGIFPLRKIYAPSNPVFIGVQKTEIHLGGIFPPI